MSHLTKWLFMTGLGLFVVGFAGPNVLTRGKPAVKITIGFVCYGDPYNGRVQREGLWRDDPDRHIPPLIQNDSNGPLDFLTDGNTWGDAALKFDVTTVDGTHHKIGNTQMIYVAANAPGIVRLQPGETWVRQIAYNSNAWGGFRKLLEAGRPKIALQVELTQASFPEFKDRYLWSGVIDSAAVQVPVY